jgi:hypothetical protein
MKGNINKLAVYVVITVMALFITATIVSAGPAIPYGIKGLYAVSGFSTCSMAGTPAGSAGSGIMEADYTFSNDGTGSATGFVRSIDAPDVNGYTSASFSPFTVNFTYAVTQGGHITFTYPNGGVKMYQTYPDGTQWWMQWDNGPSHGVISPDGKTITILCGPPVFLTGLYAVSTNSPWGESSPPAMTAYCVTSLVGTRLK